VDLPHVISSSYNGSQEYASFESIRDDEEPCPLVQNGVIQDFDLFSNLLEQVDQKLAPETTLKGSVLLCAVHPNRSFQSNEKILQHLFEEREVLATYLAPKPLLSLYSFGCTTGLSVVMGHDVTSWMPIYEGYCITDAVGDSPLAGSKITERLMSIIQENNPYVKTGKQIEPLKKNCWLAESYEAEIQLQRTQEQRLTYGISYPSDITLNTELFRAPEILFKPQLQGLDVPGLHYLIYDSIISCPLDVRKDIRSWIALGGGTSNITGLQSRLTEELSELDPLMFDNKCKVRVNSNSESPSVWTGSCIFSSLSSFNSIVISKEQYDESGPSIVHRNCPFA